MEYVLFVLVGLVGSLASAVFGFGTALLVLAVGAHILPVKETIALATVLFTASTVTKTFLFSRSIDWKMVAIMALASVPFAYLGADLLVDLPTDVARKALAVMVLLYLFLSVVDRLPRISIGTKGLVVGSALYGFVSGLLGSGNLIKVILFREMKVSKEAFVGAMAASAILNNAVKLISYSANGLLTADMAVPAAALVASGVIAAFVGKVILKRLEVRVFEVGVQLLLAVAAITLLI